MHKDKLLLERKHVQDLLLNKPEMKHSPVRANLSARTSSSTGSSDKHFTHLIGKSHIGHAI